MSTAPYPHVEMHVRDESIYTAPASEVLPLHKPLYMMRAQKGPVGVPVWCDTYTYAARVFGADTFNKRSQYFSEQAYFLLKTFPSNGAFIMRVADTSARNAEITIELGVSKADAAGEERDIPQWERDSNGRFVYNLDGEKIAINGEGEVCKTVGKTQKVYARALESIAYREMYYTRTENFIYSPVYPTDRIYIDKSYFIGMGKPKFTQVDTATDKFDSKELYFKETAEGGKYEPQFGIKEFESGAAYMKFAGFTDGYRQAATEELPAFGAGQTIGDKFDDIIATGAITITTDGGVSTASDDDANKKIYESYRFTRALSDSNPYEYAEAKIPAGTSLLNGVYYYDAGTIDQGELEPQGKLKGKKLVWRARVTGSYDPITGAYHRERDVGAATTVDTDNFTWYPMIDVVAENPGTWGQKFGFRLFFDENANTIAVTVENSAVKYKLAPVQLVEDNTVPTEITDAYGQTYTEGVMRPGVIDKTSETDLGLDKKLKSCYSGRYALPIKFTIIHENWNKVGQLLEKAEIADRDSIAKVYPSFRHTVDVDGDEVLETFVDALLSKVATDDDLVGDTGYMANVVSCVDGEKIPHFCSTIVDATDADVAADTGVDASTIIVPGANSVVYLGGGNDGNIGDADVEKQIRAQITAALGQTQEYLIDYARCPFNSIIDTGVSIDTKLAYLDLLSVRDSLVVNLATQVTWKDAAGVRPTVNERYYDESIGSRLRAYAWLMKEDIVNGTEACRAKIFLHAGYRTDHDIDVPVASTLWIALKNAEYLNQTYISRETKGLINNEADVDCWEDISWVAAAEDTKSRCWNAGLNYVQFYNMSRYHYASVRTVYRYETSILVDAGVVDALTFMKDEVRRSWAKFVGLTTPAAMLNQMITEDLNARFSYLLNGKYSFNVNVYQTEEDVKEGYVRHVDVQLIAPATNRVWIATIICKREGFNDTES